VGKGKGTWKKNYELPRREEGEKTGKSPEKESNAGHDGYPKETAIASPG